MPSLPKKEKEALLRLKNSIGFPSGSIDIPNTNGGSVGPYTCNPYMVGYGHPSEGPHHIIGLNLLKCEIKSIEDLDGLADLPFLDTLFLNDNFISGTVDFTPFPFVTQIRNLDLGNNKISEVLGLDRMKNLTELRLNDNFLFQIPHFGRLPKLETLLIYKNQITDIIGLEGLGILFRFNIDGNPIPPEVLETVKRIPRCNFARQCVAYCWTNLYPEEYNAGPVDTVKFLLEEMGTITSEPPDQSPVVLLKTHSIWGTTLSDSHFAVAVGLCTLTSNGVQVDGFVTGAGVALQKGRDIASPQTQSDVLFATVPDAFWHAVKNRQKQNKLTNLFDLIELLEGAVSGSSFMPTWA
ncbi:MAG TPA: hypothetical protein VKK79_26040 [Candidatus Lokiarchaeia archaeon]|nr:hypothetical protein [Candidatus Lokiarchaeia archaeon]